MKRMLIMVVAMLGLIIPQSCTNVVYKFNDEIVTKSIKHLKEDLNDAVTFSIGLTYNSNIRTFIAAGVKDSAMQRKIESLGKVVYVKYQKSETPASLPDSTVVFTSFHGHGTIEVMYDFATHERDFESLIPDNKKYYFRKVDERTYYRRGPQWGGTDYGQN